MESLSLLVGTRTELNELRDKYPKHEESAEIARRQETIGEGSHLWAPIDMDASGITISFIGGVSKIYGVKLKFSFSGDTDQPAIWCRATWNAAEAKQHINDAASKHPKRNQDAGKYAMFKIRKLCQNMNNILINSNDDVTPTIQIF